MIPSEYQKWARRERRKRYAVAALAWVGIVLGGFVIACLAWVFMVLVIGLGA